METENLKPSKVILKTMEQINVLCTLKVLIAILWTGKTQLYMCTSIFSTSGYNHALLPDPATSAVAN